MTTTDRPLLEVRNVGKSFPGVRALDGVDLSCRRGRVHALLGENGAGKSTLVRIITGNMQPDEGELLLDGEPVRFADPREASARGIAAVYQELTVLPAMSVADNVMLGQERSRRGLLRRDEQARLVREALDRVGLGHLDPTVPAESLSLASRQLIEIARAWLRHSRLLVLDEPSAVLAGDELGGLFALVRDLAADGVAMVYISHRLNEIAELADDITVLRDGRQVSTGPRPDYDTARIVREMVGRDVDAVFPTRTAPAGEVLMRVRGLRPAGVAPPVHAVDLDLRAGEIVGLAGLLGSGRSRLLRTLAGAAPRDGGEVVIADRRVGTGLKSAVRAGVVLVPEERKTEGLVLDLPVKANVTLAALDTVASLGVLSNRRERAAFADEKQRLGIRAAGPDQVTQQLSGGNQQKVVLAKWLRTDPRVLLLDEPTRGIDVGARTEIYRLIAQFAADGFAVLFASSDLPEVVGLSHRVLVCRDGAIVGELAGDDIDEEAIMHFALGTEDVPA
jgi:ribose transport system ATP-binding protein